MCLWVYAVIAARLRNAWLLLASLVFYTWGSGGLVLLLAVSTVVDFITGAVVQRGRDQGNRQLVKLGVGVSVATNLSMLGYFKYANFFVEQVNALSIAGIDWTEVALPVGISFFTFQSMSYTIDIARGRADHLRNPLDLGLYVALFPQLVAGPIVRFHEISAQITHRTVATSAIANGAVRFAHGLGKKVVIADSVAPIADAAFAADDPSLIAAWAGIVAYTVQIYFDFSGYSDMAIGLGMMLGFTFPENFRRPYSAVSITDFWRRWHITLSNWFRDYVYIPLGGSRATSRRTLVNLGAVFLLTGLWHGANWTFIAWGVFHGSLLMMERLTGQRPLEIERPLERIARRIVVLVLVMVGWVLFRAANIDAAMTYITDLFTPGGELPSTLSDAASNRAVLAMVIGVASWALPADLVTGRFLIGTSSPRTVSVARVATVVAVFPLALVTVASGSFSPFLYFQF